ETQPPGHRSPDLGYVQDDVPLRAPVRARHTDRDLAVDRVRVRAVTDEALASKIRDRMRTALPAKTRTADRALTAASRAAVERFHGLLHDYPRRIGKMMRGRLVIHSTHAHGGSAEEPALTVAAALELFQAWVLIH